MIYPYFARLFCICLASFFLVNLFAGLAVWSLAPWVARVAGRQRSQTAAGVMLCMRLLPLALATFITAGLCLPSYLWLEPGDASERLGPGVMAAATLGIAILLLALGRTFRAMISPGDCAVLALTGLFRTHLVISETLYRVLSPAQLRAALRHERAHARSRDNLKRLLLVLAPDIFPLVPKLRIYDRQWARYAEWAADDSAVDPESRLSLAEALICAARLGGSGHPAPLVSSLLAHDGELEARIERLLHPLAPLNSLNPPKALYVGVGLGILLLQALALQPVHGLLEFLIR